MYWRIRENIHGNDSIQLINQLIWRDFYFQLLDKVPKNLGNPLKQKFEKFSWSNNTNHFKKWCEGKTGYPIVDAGMRELNTIGYMHNRCRLITANFLTRILLINWTMGEKYFAQHLIDYDPSVNNGNWQWVAGCGTDTAPYSQRIFNPWIQSKKSDPTAEYIKQYIPELKDVEPKHLHEWDKYCDNYPDIKYPKPIVEYKKQRKLAIDTYKQI